MKNEKNKYITWIKDHKKGLIIGGVVIGTSILTIILFTKKRGDFYKIWKELKKAISTGDIPTPVDVVVDLDSASIIAESAAETQAVNSQEAAKAAFKVCGHIRTLPKGQQATPKKAAEAVAKGIILLQGQTYVDPYMKGCSVA